MSFLMCWLLTHLFFLFHSFVNTGEFLQGYRHGFGMYLYNNGDVFKGQFDQGKRHGFGQLGSTSFLFFPSSSPFFSLFPYVLCNTNSILEWK